MREIPIGWNNRTIVANFGAVSDLYGPEVDADEAVEPW